MTRFWHYELKYKETESALFIFKVFHFKKLTYLRVNGTENDDRLITIHKL